MIPKNIDKNDICLLIGGAQSVHDDLQELQAIISPYNLEDVFWIAVINDQIHTWPKRVDIFSTLHGEKAEKWLEQRDSDKNWDFLMFAHRIHKFQNSWYENNLQYKEVKDKWKGSSGLYAVQISLIEIGFQRVLISGVPMSSEPNLFRQENQWAQFNKYRAGWNKANNVTNSGEVAVTSQNTRSMSGWTAELLGKPDEDFIFSNN